MTVYLLFFGDIVACFRLQSILPINKGVMLRSRLLNGGRRLAVTSSLKFTRTAARRQFVSPGAGELHRFGM